MTKKLFFISLKNIVILFFCFSVLYNPTKAEADQSDADFERLMQEEMKKNKELAESQSSDTLFVDKSIDSFKDVAYCLVGGQLGYYKKYTHAKQHTSIPHRCIFFENAEITIQKCENGTMACNPAIYPGVGCSKSSCSSAAADKIEDECTEALDLDSKKISNLSTSALKLMINELQKISNYCERSKKASSSITSVIDNTYIKRMCERKNESTSNTMYGCSNIEKQISLLKSELCESEDQKSKFEEFCQ